MTIESIPCGPSLRKGAWCAAALGSLLLSGCMTAGGYGGGYGGYPPTGQYPQQSYPGQSASTLVGTVRGVDRNGRLVLDTQSSGYGGGSTVELMFDQRTQLYYQGQSYPVTGLEQGDVIRVDTERSGGRLWARSIEVVQNVRDRSGGQYDNQYGNQLSGAVTFVDTRSRVIQFTRGGYSGATAQVRYDDRTTVEFRGQVYRPDRLQRGDIIRIQARQWGNEWLAERIVVETSARERY